MLAEYQVADNYPDINVKALYNFTMTISPIWQISVLCKILSAVYLNL